MKRNSDSQKAPEDKPRNKAYMDEPQEEFIQPQSSHVERDHEHGDELQNARHSDLWDVVISANPRPEPD